MLRRLLIGFVLAALASAPVAASIPGGEGIPPAGKLVFNVMRGGNTIGTHTLEFRQDGDRAVVDIAIDLQVKLGFIPVFNYRHRATEVWDGQGFLSLESTTNDNGDDLSLTMRREGDQIEVDGTRFTGEVDAGVIPSTYWNPLLIDKSKIVSSQSGAPFDIEIVEEGRETVTVAGEPVEATRYRLRGEIDVFLWYDDQNRWVKCAFTARGEEVSYELETPLETTSLGAGGEIKRSGL